MSERMNGTRKREPDEEEDAKSKWKLKYDKDVYKFDKLLMNNNIEAVRQLLTTNWTLMYNYHIYYGDIHHHAIVSNTDNTDMTKLLLSHGAPVNTRAAWDSFTTLHHVCAEGKVKLCELFLTNGARYDLKTDYTYSSYFRLLTEELKIMEYNTPLHFATNVDVVKVLIR